MRTIPWYRSHIQPTKYYRMQYAYSGEQGDIGARLHSMTNRPVINLENHKMVVNVACEGDNIIVDFDSTGNSILAYESWNAVPDLVVILSNDRRCSSVSYGVRRMMVESGQMTIIGDPINWKSIISEYSVQIGSVAQRERLARRSFRKKFRMPLNSNINMTTMLPIVNLRPLLRSAIVDIHCSNCTTQGAIEMELHIVGGPTNIKSYNITVKGDVKLHFGLDLEFKTGLPLPAFEVPIGPRIPFTPIHLPGFLTIGPELRTLFIAQLQISRALWLRRNIDFHIPIHFNAYSKVGLDKPPTVKSKGTPKITTEFQKEYPKNIEFHLSAAIMPQVALTITALGFRAFDLGIGWSSMWNIEITKCNEQTGFKTRWKQVTYFLHETLLSFQIGLGRFKYPVFIPITSYKQPIGCKNCLCAAPIRKNTTIGALFKSIPAAPLAAATAIGSSVPEELKHVYSAPTVSEKLATVGDIFKSMAKAPIALIKPGED